MLLDKDKALYLDLLFSLNPDLVEDFDAGCFELKICFFKFLPLSLALSAKADN